MPRIFGIALAAAFIVPLGALVNGAEAAMPAAVLPSHAAAPVERVANVCGRNGCVAVQTKRVVHTRPGSVAAKHI
jgi:hypothetical protein